MVVVESLLLLLQTAVVVVPVVVVRAKRGVVEKDQEECHKETSVVNTIARPPNFMRDDNDQEVFVVVVFVVKIIRIDSPWRMMDSSKMVVVERKEKILRSFQRMK